VDILADGQEYEGPECVNEDLQQELDKLIPALKGDVMSADDFYDIDKEVETGKSLSEDDIVALVMSSGDDSVGTSTIDEYDPAPRIVTAKEAKTGLTDIISFLEQQEWCDGTMLLWLHDLERELNSTYGRHQKKVSVA
jgi:hypothetical protein